MKALIFGANGQLGSDITRVFQSKDVDLAAFTHAEVDITDKDAITDIVQRHKPDVVVNATAFHNLDACEANPEKAYAINADAVFHLAQLADTNDFKLLHISTDYVFNGEKAYPYVESDATDPLNVYGLSKRKGEELIVSATRNHLIARTSALYGTEPCRAKGGLNFIRLMLKLAQERPQINVVNDEFVSPTNTYHLAQQLYTLVNHDVKGIVHLTSGGFCSWYEFACEIFRLWGSDVKVEPVASDNFNKVRRPKFSVLENARVKALQLNEMPHWRDSLQTYLKAIA